MEKLNYNNLTEKVFKIKMNVLFSNGRGLDVTPYIKKTRITNDFNNNIMPKYNLLFMMPLEIIMLIQKDRDQVVFSLELTYTDVIINDKQNRTNSSIFKYYLKNTILKPLEFDDSIHDSSKINEPKDNKDDGRHFNSMQHYKFEVIAVPEDSLKSNKYVTSGAYRNCNVTEATLALVTKAPHKISIVEPDNKKRYNQIVLYPGNIFSNLYHIQNNYGIYNDDLKIYTVNDRLIISPLNSDRVMDARGPISISVEFDKRDPRSHLIKGSYDMVTDEDKAIKYMIVNRTAVTLKNNTGLIAEVFGNQNVITHRDKSNFYEEEFNIDYYDRQGEVYKTKLYENIFGNEYTRNNFLNKIKNENTMTIMYDNIDFKIDDGLRLFIMNFNNQDYSRYNGKYKCIMTTHEFTTDLTGNTFINGSITLRRI